jgi:hypothetical protein
MSNERPQTPKAVLSLESQILPLTPNIKRSYFDQDTRNLDQTPELGLDETPLSNNYDPPTPNAVLFVHNACTGTSPQNSPSKLREVKNAISSLPDVSTTQDGEGVKNEDHLQHDEIGIMVTGWLFGHNTTNRLGNKRGELKSKDGWAVNLDLHKTDTNFSSPSVLHKRNSSTSSSRGLTQQRMNAVDQWSKLNAALSSSNKVTKGCVNTKDGGQHTKLKTYQNTHAAIQIGAQPSFSLASQNEKLARILRYETFQRLIDEPRRCASSLKKTPGVRCKNTSKWAQEDTDRMIDDLCEVDRPLDIMTAKRFIDRILSKAMCNGAKHRSAAQDRLKNLLD